MKSFCLLEIPWRMPLLNVDGRRERFVNVQIITDLKCKRISYPAP